MLKNCMNMDVGQPQNIKIEVLKDKMSCYVTVKQEVQFNALNMLNFSLKTIQLQC